MAYTYFVDWCVGIREFVFSEGMGDPGPYISQSRSLACILSTLSFNRDDARNRIAGCILTLQRIKITGLRNSLVLMRPDTSRNMRITMMLADDDSRSPQF